MRRLVCWVMVSTATLVLSGEPGAQSRPAPLQGPLDITMPDGSTVGGASNQLLLFFSPDITAADRDAVTAVISARGAEVVDDIADIKMLLISVQNPAIIGALLIELQVMKGVQFAGPDLFVGSAISACTTPSETAGPIPGSGTTGWVQANNMVDFRTAANDVVIGVIDEFTVVEPGATYPHGDIVTAYIRDSGGKDPSGTTPAFDVGKNIFQIQVPPTVAALAQPIMDFIANNPGKKVILNLSWQPGICKSDPGTPACGNAMVRWNYGWNHFVQNTLVQTYGDRVIVVAAAGNGGRPLLGAARHLSSCHFIPVGGLDQTSPTVTLYPDSVTGVPIGPYAPSCGISPLSLGVMPNTPNSEGTSFAAPQVTGQLANIWAAHPNFRAPDMP